MSQTEPALAADDVAVVPPVFADELPDFAADDATDAEDTFAHLAEADVIGELPPPFKEDIDMSLEDIVERCNRTDGHLQKWRNTSVDRKLSWEEEEAVRLEAEAQRKGWFYLGAAGGVAMALLSFCAVLALSGGAVATGVGAASAPAASAVVVPPKRTEPVAAPVEQKAPEPVKAAVASPKPTPSAVVGLTLMEEARVWTHNRHAWTDTLVAEKDISLAWFDATGKEVLDRVACSGRDAGGYRCISGRSSQRVDWALTQGAAAGTWTVKACSDTGCLPLGTVDIPVK